MGAVVDHLARARHGSRFEEVDAEAFASVDDVVDAHAVTAQLAHAGLGDVVARQPRDEVDPLAVVGQRDGHVGFAAAESRVERAGLRKSEMIGCRQTQHDLSECYNFTHNAVVNF